MTNAPDIFGNVHKGIRKALFDLCVALGSAGEEKEQMREARRRTREVLHFLRHHGDNEDTLLLPLLERRAPECHARMARGHAFVAETIAAIEAVADEAPAAALYHRACALTALYLEHMREEEEDLRPAIEDALSAEELESFGRRSVERTSPPDQHMMLSYMLPAMTPRDADIFLSKLPLHRANQLRPRAKMPG